MVPACRGNTPETTDTIDISCAYAVSICQTLGTGPGPMTWIWQRDLAPNGDPSSPWVRVGQSCNQPVTVQRGRPVLTLGLVQNAFRQVTFARPAVAIQPEGMITLVNLKTYYRIQWPAAGVSPTEMATVSILGRQVRIRPIARSYTYTFGDGTRSGPVNDPGGVYPTGRITHTYTTEGRVNASVTATYSADFSVDGAPWQPVNDTVTIPGPPGTIWIRQATARLQAEPSNR